MFCSDLVTEMTQERTCLSSREAPMSAFAGGGGGVIGVVDEPTPASATTPGAAHGGCYDTLTNRITEWLTAIDLQENKQNV